MKKYLNTLSKLFEKLCLILIKFWNLKVKPLEQFLSSLFHGDAGIVEPIAISHFLPNLLMMNEDDESFDDDYEEKNSTSFCDQSPPQSSILTLRLDFLKFLVCGLIFTFGFIS